MDSADADRRTPEQHDQARNSEETRFQFVLGRSQPGIRSHAMRQFWRRRQRTNEDLSHPIRNNPSTLRTLLPKSNQARSQKELEDFQQQLSAQQGDQDVAETGDLDTETKEKIGIPAQVLSGIELAFASVDWGPFKESPVTMTAEHHKLLYHWLSLHTDVIFETFPNTTFNPVREVWLPMDFSNIASFNAMMAHAAAHLAYLHGEGNSPAAFKYKVNAVSIIAEWLGDPAKALSDETLIAVVRLLMFEKYWGLEDQWRIHRDGLECLLEARGGPDSLKAKWRLELIVFQAFSMAAPSSSSDPSIYTWEFSEYFIPCAVHPTLQSIVDRYKPHVFEGLWKFPAIHTAVLDLYTSSGFAIDDSRQEKSSSTPDHGLKCLLFLSLVMQQSIYSSVFAFTCKTGTDWSFTNDLAALDTFLHESSDRWRGSPQELCAFLFSDFSNHIQRLPGHDFTMKFTDILGQLSEDARRGIEKCLFNMLLWKK